MEIENNIYTPTNLMLPTSHYDKTKADQAVQFIEQLKHTKGIWANKPFKLMGWQERIIRDVFGIVKEDGYRQFNTAYVEIGKKNGKQLDINTLIPTPTGFTKMGDLKIGDLVFDEKGNPCHVIAKSQIDDKEQAYKITFKDDNYIIAGARHLWDVEYIYGKRKNKIMTTEEIYNKTISLALGINESLIRIGVSKPLVLEDKNLPIDPYLYGYWLGNGNANKPCITVRTCDVNELLSYIPYKPYNIFNNVGDSKIIYFKELKKVLVSNFRDKKIPLEYLRASEKQRWRLLQGLIDSDGCIGTRKAQSTYISTVKDLALSVSELLWTLGIKNNCKQSKSTRYSIPTGENLYTVRFTTFDDQPTSKLQRKIERKRRRVKKTRSCFHYIKTIEPIRDKVKMQCIQVDSMSHCYLVGKSMVKTHNSELAAAVALKLLCADREQGAEIYGAAADRQQASIVFEVAAEMVRLSPTLRKHIKILAATKRLVFQKTNSFYQVLSADVATKHGFNVHGMVMDEVHAQPNRKLYDVLTKGSGDARKQPLFFLITTAGTDTNSICYEVHQKAKDILEGKKIDHTFYPVIYGADMDDDWTNEEVWKKSNPSLGITIDIEKVRNACEQARQNPLEENTFRQLRLNQWVKQAVRWMPMEQWDKCKRDIDFKMLEGRECYGGLDLSSTSDVTAFVLVFPPVSEDKDTLDGKYIIHPTFWLPEDTLDLRVNKDHVPYDLWYRQGFFDVTSGNVVDYDYIEKAIYDLSLKYRIKQIAFDPWNATQTSIHLQNEGFEMVEFRQGFKSMSPACKELFKLVLEEQIVHNGHPVLRWMMDNIAAKRDPADNIKFDKEKSSEKIDGAVALAMALGLVINRKDEGSVYDSRGLLIL